MLTFDEAKRATNLEKHGIDFADLGDLFDLPMITIEDTRETYGETRLVSLGVHANEVVVLVWTERHQRAHLISCRKATRHEKREYLKAF